MADKSTYIKLDRNILQWRWFKSTNTLSVFLYLLLQANVSDHDFMKQTIHRGQVATSLKTIEKQCGLTTMQVRTALSHLKLTGEITIKSTNRYQVITIVNYSLYQNVQTNKLTGQSADKQQTNNKQITNKQQQYKNIKNVRSKEIPPKSPKGDFPPSGSPERGTDAFRAKAHLLLQQDEGTVDDIPTVYRDGTYQSFDNFEDYWRWRNQ